MSKEGLGLGEAQVYESELRYLSFIRYKGGTVYLFMRTKNKDTSVEEKDPSPKEATTHIAATSVSSAPITNPVIKREPIPEDQQLELFKWILDEKRKVKPKDAEEKRQIDEEKALLKKYIRSKSIPRI